MQPCGNRMEDIISTSTLESLVVVDSLRVDHGIMESNQ